MESRKLSIQLLIAVLGTSFSIEGLSMVDVLMEAKARSLQGMEHKIGSQIGSHEGLWMPRTVRDIRDYFSYHKDFEVLVLMEAANKELGLNIPSDLIKTRSSRHDLPKVESFKNLAHHGYLGWERELAVNFLSALLGLSKEFVSENLPKAKYLQVDIATRLLFSFGISRSNYESFFPKESHEAILAELKALPKELNRIEEIIKKEEALVRAGTTDHRTESLLNLIEIVADKVSRTENALARIEYSKIFVPTSSYLRSDIQILKGNTPGPLSFVYKELKEQVGEEYLKEIGLENILALVERMEKDYAKIIKEKRGDQSQKYRILSERAFEQSERTRVDFFKMNMALRKYFKANLCEVAF